MLREAEVQLSQGGTTGDICHQLCVSKQSYDRWRKEHGGLKVDHLQPIKSHMQDQSIISEQERMEETESILRAYDNLEEAFDRDVQDQRFSGGPPDNQ